MSANLIAALKAQDAIWQLQRHLNGATGLLHDALDEAISYLQAGMRVPTDIASIIANHTSFKQDRYGK